MPPTTAYDYAIAPGGIGLEAMNKNIQNFFAGNPTQEQTEAAMREYLVTDADIQRATGKSFADYFPVQGGLSTATAAPVTGGLSTLPTSGFDAFGNPRGNTWTEDRYNPNDPASSRYIADPNAGQYVFDQVTGKPTLVSSTSALSTATATDALPTTSFDAFGNQKSGTWTEDRYNPNDPASKSYLADPNAGQYVFDPVTGKPKLVSSTGATSVTGNVAPIGSLAYQSATGKGGIGLDAMNQNILNYLATNPTEVAALAKAKKWGVSKEDIERATGKTYEQIFPETFRPGSVLSSGFGNVIEQLRGSGYYKGVAIPTFREYGGDDNNPPQTVADQLAAWKANIDRQDLSARAPFGFVETPVYTQPTGDYDAYVSGYQSTPATALDYLTKNNPVIANAVYGHTSTDARAYKVVNGELKEVGQDQITPEDIAQGNAFFMLAGKTGGPNRERMAQLYRADGDNLIPVGDPKMYKGAVEQDMGLAFLDMAASALSFVPGPWQIPAVAYKAIRGAIEGDWTAFAKAFLPPVVATAVNIYEAVESKDPFRIATSLLGSDVMPQVGSFDLGGGITVNDAVKAAKVVDALNNGQYDVAAILAGDLSNTPELSTAGTALRIKNLLDQGLSLIHI